MSNHEHSIRERAYHLWEKEGRPEGREHEFWERARLMHEADQKPAAVTATPDKMSKVDEASAESFPASDPPAFTPPAGTRKGKPG